MTQMTAEERQKLATEFRVALLHDAQYLSELRQVLVSSPSPAHEKPFWRFWNAPNTPAIITVFLGGVLVAVLNGCIQKSMKEREIVAQREATDRELQHDIVSSANATQLELQKATSEAQVQIAREAMEIVNHMITRTRDYIHSRGPRFAIPVGEDPSARELRLTIQHQKEQIRLDFNSAETEWKTKHGAVGNLLVLYFFNDANVAERWNSLASSVDEYIDFASRLNPADIPPDKWSDELLLGHESPIHNQVRDLNSSMLTARLEHAHRWPDVDHIKELLAKLDDVKNKNSGGQ
ncbi:MAG TPA: hypothetical protein VMM76_15555 [Pirellulaceae bacterium]|nr:hypothetical protein [Pirellulaceae bacterium]